MVNIMNMLESENKVLGTRKEIRNLKSLIRRWNKAGKDVTEKYGRLVKLECISCGKYSHVEIYDMAGNRNACLADLKQFINSKLDNELTKVKTVTEALLVLNTYFTTQATEVAETDEPSNDNEEDMKTDIDTNAIKNDIIDIVNKVCGEREIYDMVCNCYEGVSFEVFKVILAQMKDSTGIWRLVEFDYGMWCRFSHEIAYHQTFGERNDDVVAEKLNEYLEDNKNGCDIHDVKLFLDDLLYNDLSLLNVLRILKTYIDPERYQVCNNWSIDIFSQAIDIDAEYYSGDVPFEEEDEKESATDKVSGHSAKIELIDMIPEKRSAIKNDILAWSDIYDSDAMLEAKTKIAHGISNEAFKVLWNEIIAGEPECEECSNEADTNFKLTTESDESNKQRPELKDAVVCTIGRIHNQDDIFGMLRKNYGINAAQFGWLLRSVESDGLIHVKDGMWLTRWDYLRIREFVLDAITECEISVEGIFNMALRFGVGITHHNIEWIAGDLIDDRSITKYHKDSEVFYSINR